MYISYWSTEKGSKRSILPLMATASFAAYLQKPWELPVPEFRAPPPSPVTGVLTGSSSGSSGDGECQDDDEIGRFLRCSARVPVLRLPDGAVPRQKKKKAAWAPPIIEIRLLDPPSPVAGGGPGVEALKSAAVAFGCFQVVGHGVDGGLLSAALRAATAREGPPAPGEMEGIGGNEDGEELWWPPGEGDHEMAGNWPSRTGGKQFRNRADDLFTQLEQTSTKLMHALQQGSAAAGATEVLPKADRTGSLLCIRKNHREQGSASGPISQDDVLRMLVRSSRCSRALALHLCPGASAFHVFSRRGWSRFRPLDGAIVVTVGDQLQAWSGGLYKGVSGKPAYSSKLQGVRGDSDAVSAEFFLSCSSAGTAKEAMDADVGKVVPLNLQIMVAACFVLVYHFFLSCLYAVW